MKTAVNTALKSGLHAAREDVIAARKCKNINDPIDTYVVDYVAMIFSKLFIKLHIIPNAITMLSMVCGVSGGILLCMKPLYLNLIGLGLVILAAVFDACDGQVARMTKHFSRLGRMLDGLSDATGYFTLYLACVIRLLPRSPFARAGWWYALVILLGLADYLLYIRQCQLPDYFKNLHMYMLDDSIHTDLTRAKDVKAEAQAAKKGSFDHFSLWCYYLYTITQEKRAPQTQKLLDAIGQKGKTPALCDAFYEKSKVYVLLTNLLTFNLRTIVLMIGIFLHLELIGMLFVIVVLEPIRWILLRKYENLSRSLLPMLR